MEAFNDSLMNSQGIMPHINQGVCGVPSVNAFIFNPYRMANPMISKENAGCKNPQATPMKDERYRFLKSHHTIPGMRPRSLQNA